MSVTIGRKLDDERLVGGRVTGGAGDGRGQLGILPEEDAAALDVGAGDVHFQRGHAFLFIEAGGQLAEFGGGGGVKVGDDGQMLPGQAGELFLAEGFHAVVLQAHGH